MRSVALKIPLGPFALVWSRQRRNTADARVETLGDPLDHAAFAGRIAAFENHHDFLFVLRNPVLQLHQLALQAEQLAEVELPVDAILLEVVIGIGQEPIKAVIIQLHFVFFVEAVDQISSDTFPNVGFLPAHKPLLQDTSFTDTRPTMNVARGDPSSLSRHGDPILAFKHLLEKGETRSMTVS